MYNGASCVREIAIHVYCVHIGLYIWKVHVTSSKWQFTHYPPNPSKSLVIKSFLCINGPGFKPIHFHYTAPSQLLSFCNSACYPPKCMPKQLHIRKAKQVKGQQIHKREVLGWGCWNKSPKCAANLSWNMEPVIVHMLFPLVCNFNKDNKLKKTVYIKLDWKILLVNNNEEVKTWHFLVRAIVNNATLGLKIAGLATLPIDILHWPEKQEPFSAFHFTTLFK